uniref:Uncharacterized protein n=1 Tax=Arundo donax TaxID=35708 RepID=A0A0A8Y7V7_ARUDO
MSLPGLRGPNRDGAPRCAGPAPAVDPERLAALPRLAHGWCGPEKSLTRSRLGTVMAWWGDTAVT